MMKRNTIQRTLVLETVTHLHCHATADEVYHAIAAEHPHISRATVYRNLNLLSQSGDILKVEVPGGADRFDHQCHDHYHARCQRCGAVVDVEMPYITGLEQAAGATDGFQITGHDILFQGICPACRESHPTNR